MSLVPTTPRPAAQDLLELSCVTLGLGVAGRHFAGLRTIPVERIVGSVDRAHDFSRTFTPRSKASRARIEGLRRAFPDGDLPPIQVVEVGGAYFVVDGHHRVALTRERGGEFLDAEVVRLDSGYDIPPDVDLPTLHHTKLERHFLEESGLGRARPGARLEVSDPAAYGELLESVRAHGFALAVRLGRVPDMPEVAASWWDEVYEPAAAALRDAGADTGGADGAETDAVLALLRARRDGCASGRGCGWAEAIGAIAHERRSWRERRARRRRASAPLRPRVAGRPQGVAASS